MSMTEYITKRSKEIESKPHQKTYIFRYGLDGENTKTVRASNKKDAMWLARVGHIKSCTIIN